MAISPTASMRWFHNPSPSAQFRRSTDQGRQLIQELRERFAGVGGVQRYLDERRAGHDRARRGVPASGGAALRCPFLPAPGAFLDRYRVNVLVDRSDARGAPVVFEQNPTHAQPPRADRAPRALRRPRDRLHAHQGGALHRANGGYLILEAADVLRSFQGLGGAQEGAEEPDDPHRGAAGRAAACRHREPRPRADPARA